MPAYIAAPMVRPMRQACAATSKGRPTASSIFWPMASATASLGRSRDLTTNSSPPGRVATSFARSTPCSRAAIDRAPTAQAQQPGAVGASEVAR